jgi:UDP-glucose 4-epimerase
MRVFVTGIAGFLGSHLAERLLTMGHEIVGCDSLLGGELINVPPEAEFYQYDCRDFNAMAKVMRGCELVYHCAATAYEGLSVFSPAMVMDNIVTGSVSVFSAAIANGARRIVLCSSMARYGTNEVPFLESYAPRPQDPYGIAKVAAEQALLNLAQVHGIEYAIAVPHNIIGSRQKFDDPYRNVASIMANLMLQGRRPFIYGDGHQQRCFSHVEDCITCLLAMGLTSRGVGEVVNIGPDEEFVSINQLFQKLKAIIGTDSQAIHVTDRPQEVKNAVCSASKARDILGYRTTRSLDAGLNDIVDYIRKVGPRKFRYHLDIELRNHRTPRTWTERLM